MARVSRLSTTTISRFECGGGGMRITRDVGAEDVVAMVDEQGGCCYLYVRLPLDAAEELTKLANRVRGEGGGVIEVVSGRPKTSQQNRLLHRVCRDIARETGYSLEEVKMWLKHEAMGRGYPVDAESLLSPLSTAHATVDEEAVLLDVALDVAATFGLLYEMEVGG